MFIFLFLCIFIFLAAFGFGTVPLHFSLSGTSVTRLAKAGSGVLIASALAIIIPEGCKAVYAKPELSTGDSIADKLVGLAIVGGFILMFAIEQLSAHEHKTGTTASYIAVDNLHQLHEHTEYSLAHTESSESRSAISSTIGLCIHSLADGIALGSSAHAPTSLSFIVFLAILLHKGPAAFGLVSILMAKRLPRKMIQWHLAAFSIAAPLGALITYIIMALLGLSSSGATSQSTGLLLLFSGGTFLFVAVSHASHEKLDFMDFLSVLAGLVVPCLIPLFMDHDHE